MSKQFIDVVTFLTACGQKRPNSPTEPSEVAKLYETLINEEYGELQDALKVNDDIETIDACFDLMWVIIGYMHSRGWDLDEIWEEGAKSNLSKINIRTGEVIRRDDGKILKPEGWSPPDFKRFAEK